VRSILGVVFGLVGPGVFFPRYSSNIAFISNLMEDFKVSKEAKFSFLEIKEMMGMEGGLTWGGVSLVLSSSLESAILLGG
jgi:hypothetical protein